jgi:hypothetical protein
MRKQTKYYGKVKIMAMIRTVLDSASLSIPYKLHLCFFLLCMHQPHT